VGIEVLSILPPFTFLPSSGGKRDFPKEPVCTGHHTGSCINKVELLKKIKTLGFKGDS
jgi:hypothetical protein